MLLGAHVSIGGGVPNSPGHGVRLGCDVIQIFTRSQRQWTARPYTPEEIEAFRTRFAASGLKGVVAHGSYLMNLAGRNEALRKKSLDAFLDEASRCDQLGVPDYVFHPGAHLGEGVDVGIRRIAEAMKQTLAQTKAVRLDLECMAGQGSTIGNRLEDLAAILDLVDDKDRTGVCLDTCHMFAAGYDLATPEGYAETMQQIERVLGLGRVRAFHLNDSMGVLDCRRDRHAQIGAGHIGRSGFGLLMNDSRFARIPMNLETPGGDEGYVADLKILRSLIGKRAPAPKRHTLASFSTPAKPR